MKMRKAKRSWRVGVLCAGIGVIACARPIMAAPILTLANGVNNPAAPLQTTKRQIPQYAVADTVGLVPVSSFAGVLQATLTAQGFTTARNWSLVTGAVSLAVNAVYNLTAYSLALNSGGTAFGETIQFTLNPDLASPTVPAGSTATLHWLQYINSNSTINGYGFTIPNQSGYWQVDNGQINGGTASGAASGPYYDSNAGGATYSTPPAFYDFPDYYSGIGTYLHFDTVPVWDIYTPAANGSAATESIDVGDYAVSWGFTVGSVPVPEPIGFGLVLFAWLAATRRYSAGERSSAN